MKVTVKVDVDTAKIMRQRGLGSSTAFRKHLASKVKDHCDPYTPFQSGTLATKTASIASDGSAIIYSAPYAHYQYYGKVMGGRAPKEYTGADLDYHGGPTRGPRWDERMMADKREDLERDLALFIRKGV